MKRTLIIIALLALLAVGGTVQAQGELTLEGLAAKIAELLTGQEDLAERVAAIETAIAPTPTPKAPPTATPIPTATPVPAPDTVLVVTVARGNVRAGPGTQHAIVGSVSQGDALEGPYQETGGWYQFCCTDDGEKAWISATLVSVKGKEELTNWENARKDAIEVDPETLLRFNDDYWGKVVYFSNAQVLQSLNDQILVYLDSANAASFNFENVAWLIYDNSNPRVLESDEIEFVAIVLGLHTYETASYGTRTVLLLEVVELRLAK